jgi:hypothetical protein
MLMAMALLLLLPIPLRSAALSFSAAAPRKPERSTTKQERADVNFKRKSLIVSWPAPIEDSKLVAIRTCGGSGGEGEQLRGGAALEAVPHSGRDAPTVGAGGLGRLRAHGGYQRRGGREDRAQPLVTSGSGGRPQVAHRHDARHRRGELRDGHGRVPLRRVKPELIPPPPPPASGDLHAVQEEPSQHRLHVPNLELRYFFPVFLVSGQNKANTYCTNYDTRRQLYYCSVTAVQCALPFRVLYTIYMPC